MLDIEEVVASVQTTGRAWALNSAAYHRFDKGFKSKFAEVKDLVRKTGTPPNNKWTQDSLEDATHCHPDWKTFLDDMQKAYENLITSKVEYDNWRNALDAARSIMASERAERFNG